VTENKVLSCLLGSKAQESRNKDIFKKDLETITTG